MDLRLVKSPKGTKLKFVVWHAGRKHLACLRTAKAAVANMICLLYTSDAADE